MAVGEGAVGGRNHAQKTSVPSKQPIPDKIISWLLRSAEISQAKLGSRSLMDKMAVCGTAATGPIPVGSTNQFGGLAEWQCTALEKRRAQVLRGSSPLPSALSSSKGSCSLMDRVLASEAGDIGSIPIRSTIV